MLQLERYNRGIVGSSESEEISLLYESRIRCLSTSRVESVDNSRGVGSTS